MHVGGGLYDACGAQDADYCSNTRGEKMRILGIDPGYGITGYSIIDYIGNRFRLIGSGAIKTDAKMPFPLRLNEIYKDLNLIIEKYEPDAISVEELFFNNNAKTAINVAQARGVILVVGCQREIPTYEYTPLQVKQAVVGYGRADKIQVQKMVKTIFILFTKKVY